MEKVTNLLLSIALIVGFVFPANAQDLTLVGVALQSSFEAPLAGVYVHGNYAYVGGMSVGYSTSQNIGLRIVDLSDPSNPGLVGRIPLRSQGFSQNHTHGDAVATHIATSAFQGDVAIVLNGVPDTFEPESYPEPYGIWDVTDPSNPAFLSVVSLGNSVQVEDGDLGDKPWDAKAVGGNYFFTIYDEGPSPTKDLRVGVVDISDPRNPVVVGDWQDDIEVALLGLSLNQAGTRAYVTGVWPKPWGTSASHGYVYVLDIQNPFQPTEIGRYVFPLRGIVSSVPIAVATSDDAYVVFADGSWQSGKCSILHILDVSNLAAIQEISIFSLPESAGTCAAIAWDVAIAGDLVYSTWGGGGVRAIDISDPTNPVEVGEFFHPSPGNWLSDVAILGDDLAVTSTVWWSGLYILSAGIQTSAEEEITVPNDFSLSQNYPNPFNPTTTIRYDLPKRATVSLKIYDLLGREMAILVDEQKPAGRYEVSWNAGGIAKRAYASGVYVYRFQAGSFSQVKKMSLIR